MSYQSPLRGCPIIDSANDSLLLPPTGVECGLLPDDLYDDGMSSSYLAQWDRELIPRDEWDERIEEIDRTNGAIDEIAIAAGYRIKNQRSTPYCWVFGSTTTVEVARILSGAPHVPLSPASVGAPVTGFRKRGGWAREAFQYGSEHGWVPSSEWPDTAIDRRFDTPENNGLRSRFQVDEWWQLPGKSFDHVATALLLGFPVTLALMWWRHLVAGFRLVKLDGTGRYGIKGPNSWGEGWGENGYAIWTEEKATPDECYVPRLATAA